MKVKALMYTIGEAQKLEALPFDLTKEEFEKGSWDTEKTEVYCETLSCKTKQLCFLINGIHVFALFFDNGMIYECNKGYRHLSSLGKLYDLDKEKEDILNVYNKYL